MNKHAEPVRYTPCVEKPESDAADTIAELNRTLRKILDMTYEDRPLGSSMRKAAYDMSARFRSQRNSRPVHEPRGASELGL